MAQTPHRPPSRGGNGEPAKDPEVAAREERAARDEAEAATAHLPTVGQPRQPPMTPEEAAPDEPTVKMNFPHPVVLTLEGYRMVRFEEGVQDVPESLAAHPYLEANGATRVR
jgi:hypothetical protein